MTEDAFVEKAIATLPAIIDGVCDSDPTLAVGQLRALRFRVPRLYVAIVLALSEPFTLARWLDAVVQHSPMAVTGFLRVLSEYLSKKGRVLADDYLTRYAPLIVRGCIATDIVWNLRTFTRVGLPKLLRAMQQALVDDADALVEAATRTLAGEASTSTWAVLGMSRFLSAVDSEVAKRLVALVVAPEFLEKNVNRSLRRAVTFVEDLGEGAGPEFAAAAVARMSPLLFASECDVTAAQTLGKTLRLLELYGRREEAVKFANLIVRRAALAPWAGAGFHLVALSHVVRLAEGVAPDELLTFLDVALAAPRGPAQLQMAETGPLVGFVFSLWGNPALPSERMQMADIGSELSSRLSHRMTPESVGDAARIAGACDVFDIQLPFYPVDSVNDSLLDSVIRTSGLPEKNFVSGAELQLWVGIRALAKRRSTPWRIAPDVGAIVWGMWRATSRDNEKMAALHASMCSWLESCAAASWALIAEEPLSLKPC
jgi:hypothetical protein